MISPKPFTALRFPALGMALSLLTTAPFATTAQAQSAAECIAPQQQQLMNACAFREYEQADAALNAAWKTAKAYADTSGLGGSLLNAQRAWLAYRDAACEAQAAPYQGGSIQPLIRATCLSELTAQRTRMLLDFLPY